MASTSKLRPGAGMILQKIARTTGAISVSGALAQTATPVLAATSRLSRASAFSTSAPLQDVKSKRDNNRLRGISSIYRRSKKARMLVHGEPLPKPADYKPKDDIKTDPNHGLWQFFYAKDSALPLPADEEAHGRPWTVEELRRKSWEDLHKLWWTCVKERNRISTARLERDNLQIMAGKNESEGRDDAVRKTMKAIKFALTERYYAWEDARTLAAEDPEIDLTGNGNAFTPAEYLPEEEMVEDEANVETDHPTTGEKTIEREAMFPETGAGEKSVDPSTIPSTTVEAPSPSARQ